MTRRRPQLLSKPALDLDLLRTLVVIVECRSFTGAATVLGRAQSTLSLQMQKLEGLLKTKLLVRTGGHVSPTPDGQILLGYAQELLEIAERAVVHTTSRDVVGKVRLGTQEDFAIRRLPNILARFTASHPQIEIEVVCGLGKHILRDLNQGLFDIALLRSIGGIGRGERLWRERMAWVGSLQRMSEAGQPIPLILYPDGCFYRRRIFQALRNAGKKWRVVYTSSSSASVQAAAKAGLGVTALAAGTIVPGIDILERQNVLPKLPDVDSALYRSPKVTSYATERLAEHVVRSLLTNLGATSGENEAA